jgi:hypothetical protein
MSALDSLKLFWKCYVDIFEKSDDLIVLFNMKRYLTPDYPFVSVDDDDSGISAPSFELFNMIRNIIQAGIDEGFFEHDANPTLVAHTIISLFSLIVENAMKSPKEPHEADAVFFGEMRNIFQIILRGIAREGIERSRLALENMRGTAKLSGNSGSRNIIT